MIALTISLVFVFGYFGVDKMVHPEYWIGWIPRWMDGLLGLTDHAWLIVIALAEIFLAVLLLMPVPMVRRIGGILICIHLMAILTQTGWNDIAVRDIGLLGATLALLCVI